MITIRAGFANPGQAEVFRNGEALTIRAGGHSSEQQVVELEVFGRRSLKWLVEELRRELAAWPASREEG